MPGYAQIGALAPILLVAARLLQGLSLGGEYGTSATYLSEVATPHRRGFYSSFQYVTLTSGQLLALGVQIILQQLLTRGADARLGLADRVRHRSGGRRDRDVAAAHDGRVGELQAGRRRTNTERGSLKVLLAYPRECLTVVGLTLGGTIAFYTFTTYMQKFMINTTGLPKEQVTWINFVALVIFVGLQPLIGALSDRIGRRPLLIAFGIGATLCTVPLLTAVARADSALSAFGLMMIGLVIVSGYTSINAVVKAELFPARIRALGVGLPYALTVAIFGGTTEYVALGLKNIGHENWFFFYVAGAALISLLVYVFMGESSSSLAPGAGDARTSVLVNANSPTPWRFRGRLRSISTMRVLLVEDDEGVASALAELLGHAGATVVRTGRGADALHRVKGCDLVLLDLGLPDMDGLDVLRTLRRASAVPVIIMTARDSDGAVVLGLRAGADDYLVKPVRKAVLLARIEAVMRRVRRVAGDVRSPAGPVVAGPVTIDRERREVTLEGTPQALTKTEFQILATLAARQGEAVSREELMLEVWGTAVVGRSRSLDFFIGQIRAKLVGLPLQTVRGFGFRLDT